MGEGFKVACSAIWQNILELTCTWDLGRRCSLDCSYCPPHRHNNWSPHATFEELTRAARLPLTYSRTMKKYAGIDIRTQINFTGGEPTLNPEFLSLCEHIHDQDPKMRLGLTTNGLFSEDYAHKVSHKVNNVVISYHCEATMKAKKRIQENTKLLNQLWRSGEGKLKNVRVNLMVHAKDEYFNECVELAHYYKENNINFIPRYIGEHPADKGAHRYTDVQLQFFKDNWEGGNSSKSSCKSEESQDCSGRKSEGKKVGRPCCGGRTFKEVDVKGTADAHEINELLGQSSDSTHLVDRNFKGWFCFVNLFFLHIHQEEGLVYYHQTCKANQKGERGPIGRLDEMDKIVEEFERSFQEKTLEPVVCPNTLCNCGLCITKSTSKNFMNEFKKQTFPGLD
jgi:molybdenum cofactor biosynthesis enzyme MoaA